MTRMQRSSLAPLLSATLSRVSCWITLLGFLHYFDHAPALVLGDGTRLRDAHQVAHAALVLLVVGLETDPLLKRLLVERVRLQDGDLDDHRLVHLVRDHVADPYLALTAFGGGRLRHFFSSSSSAGSSSAASPASATSSLASSSVASA